MSKTSTTTTRKTATRKPVAKPAVKAAAKPATRATRKAAPAKASELVAKTPAKRVKAVDVSATIAETVKKATSNVKQAASNLDASAPQFIESGEKIMNDQVKQFTDLQARTFEPMRIFSALAADAMEQVVRKNYEVMGDIVDFSVKQVQQPVTNENVTEVAQAKMAETTAFSELLGNRANEYVELGNQFSQKAREAAEEAAASAKAA